MFGVGVIGTLGLDRLGGAHFGGGGAFDPGSLFGDGEQGAWFDPSDRSTMFQDAAGTLPVTADGQPVGLILDKSRGLVLGPENVQPDYFTNSSGWELGSGFSLSGGALVFSSVGVTKAISGPPIGNVSGKFVKVTYTVSGFSGPTNIGLDPGFLYTGPGSTGALIETRVSANGTFSFQGYASRNVVSWLGRDGSFFTVTNLSVKELPGNHATQPTTTARPLYKTDGTRHWLQFDGIDDSLSTAAINFTGTDKMSVFAGVRATRISGIHSIFGISAIPASNVGTCWVEKEANNDAYVFGLKGSGRTQYQTGNNYPEPITNTLSCQFDLSQSTRALEILPKVNNAVPEVLIGGLDASAGTGGFGNHICYIGSRGGAIIFLEGSIYSLIVLGRLATTQEITDTETWVNSKTGAY